MIAAPNRPAEMRSFDPDMVTRLLDLVSSHFDHVVIDMPRTWFSWTDSVLLGSNRLFIVSEMTVPGLRHAAGWSPPSASGLATGRSRRSSSTASSSGMFGSGLRKPTSSRRSATCFAGAIPNNYRLVREAIDRGVPLDEVKAGNKITAQLKQADAAADEAASGRAPWRAAWSRSSSVALAR